jgi:hypothetical protein
MAITTECIEFEGTLWPAPHNYGRVGDKKAHRLAWEQANGPIPDGMCVCHRCNHKPCVNPDHLYLATSRQNTIDAYRDGLITPAVGERHSQSKLTEAEVLEVRASTLSGRQLAHRYGVDPMTISYIRRRITWRHI